jgi:DNA repair protein RecO (recombination protein O)
MIHKTKAIVLRTIKYGETSLVVTMLTEKFGVQRYMVNGVRKQGQKNNKSIMLQPCSILSMEVYHNELKQLQRIKEHQWYFVYQQLLSDVFKNTIATFIIELMLNAIQRPENNVPLYEFCEDTLMKLDSSSKASAANFPLFFSLQLAQQLGFGIPANHLPLNDTLIYDLAEACYRNDKPQHNSYLEGKQLTDTLELLKVMHTDELEQFQFNRNNRKELLQLYLDFFALQWNDFKKLRSLDILQTIL